MNSKLTRFLPLLDFLSEVLGRDAEIVLHDVHEVDHSIVAIKNGKISGRTVGSPATNIVLKVMKEKGTADLPYIANYHGASKDGKQLRSSTFFIRDDDGKLLGLLCINIDTSRIEQMRNFLEAIPAISDAQKPDVAIERFNSSVEDLAFESIDNVIKEMNIPANRMSQEEKTSIVRKLNENGVFLLKGALSKVASRLMVSEATVYRYINAAKKEDGAQ